MYLTLMEFPKRSNDRVVAYIYESEHRQTLMLEFKEDHVVMIQGEKLNWRTEYNIYEVGVDDGHICITIGAKWSRAYLKFALDMKSFSLKWEWCEIEWNFELRDVNLAQYWNDKSNSFFI